MSATTNSLTLNSVSYDSNDSAFESISDISSIGEKQTVSPFSTNRKHAFAGKNRSRSGSDNFDSQLSLKEETKSVSTNGEILSPQSTDLRKRITVASRENSPGGDTLDLLLENSPGGSRDSLRSGGRSKRVTKRVVRVIRKKSSTSKTMDERELQGVLPLISEDAESSKTTPFEANPGGGAKVVRRTLLRKSTGELVGMVQDEQTGQLSPKPRSPEASPLTAAELRRNSRRLIDKKPILDSWLGSPENSPGKGLGGKKQLSQKDKEGLGQEWKSASFSSPKKLPPEALSPAISPKSTRKKEKEETLTVEKPAESSENKSSNSPRSVNNTVLTVVKQDTITAIEDRHTTIEDTAVEEREKKGLVAKPKAPHLVLDEVEDDGDSEAGEGGLAVVPEDPSAGTSPRTPVSQSGKNQWSPLGRSLSKKNVFSNRVSPLEPGVLEKENTQSTTPSPTRMASFSRGASSKLLKNKSSWLTDGGQADSPGKGDKSVGFADAVDGGKDAPKKESDEIRRGESTVGFGASGSQKAPSNSSKVAPLNKEPSARNGKRRRFSIGGFFQGSSEKASWALAKGYCRQIHTSSYLNAIRISQGEVPKVLCASSDSTIHGYSIADGSHVSSLEGHTDRVISLAVSNPFYTVDIVPSSDAEYRSKGRKNRNRGSNRGSNGSQHTDEVEQEAELEGLEGKEKVLKTLVVSGGRDELLKIWDLDTGVCLHSIHAHRSPIWAVAIAVRASGEVIVVSTSGDGSMRSWNGRTGKKLLTFKGHTDKVLTVFILNPLSDNPLVVSGGSDKRVRIWELLTGNHLKLLEGHSDEVTSVVAGTFNGFAGLTTMGAKPAGDPTPSLATESSSDKEGKSIIIVSASRDTTVRVWDFRTGFMLYELSGHSGCVYQISLIRAPSRNTSSFRLDSAKEKTVTPGTPLIVSCSEDATVRVWSLNQGKQVKVFKWHNVSVRGLDAVLVSSEPSTMAVEGDRRLSKAQHLPLVASCGWDKTVQLHQLDDMLYKGDGLCCRVS